MIEQQEPRSQSSAGLLARGAVFVACTAYLLTTVLLVLLAIGIGLVRGYEPIVITSDSMVPVIRTGDVVLAERTDPGTISTGDVAVFDRPGTGGLLSHRVAAVDGSTLTTRGDANGAPDSTPVDAGEVQGVGRVLVPFIGLPVVWAGGGDWFQLTAWVLTLVAALAVVRHLSDDERWKAPDPEVVAPPAPPRSVHPRGSVAWPTMPNSRPRRGGWPVQRRANGNQVPAVGSATTSDPA